MSLGVERFPKEARLLSTAEYRFRPFRCVQTEHFRVLYTVAGKGRLGISISKKSLRKASSRNRVKRLLKESFRKKINNFEGLDVNWVGLSQLETDWRSFTQREIDAEMEDFLARLQRPRRTV